MEIKQISIADIIPYEKNAKTHPDEQIEHIANSIREFGFKQPLVLDSNNVVIIGHGRLLAAKRLGLSEVPVLYADDLTDAQVKALRLADNKTNESEWDFSALDAELDDLRLDFDMSDFGFVLDDDEEQGIDVQEDEVQEPPEEPKSKVGDLYQLGEHRLICGDSTDPEVIERLICKDKIKLSLTDPPYGINIVSGGGTIGTGNWHRKSWGGVENSTSTGKVGGGSMNTPIENRITPNAVVPARQYKKIIGDDTTETAKKNYEIVKELSENQIIFGGNYFTDFLPASRCWVVWDKNNTGNFADAELAWTSFDKGVKLYRWTWNGLVRQGDRNTEGVSRVHPTQKPVGLIGNILQDFSDEGDIILDCFGGSGSTLIACEQTGRRCYMAELDPHYVDVIIQRWENLTGQKAVKIE